MGYRGHVVTKHREYGASIFINYGQFEKYVDKLRDLYPDEELVVSKAEDYHEIDKVIIEEEIVRLTLLDKDDAFEFQSEWDTCCQDTNGDVLNNLQLALDESPKDSSYVTLEWY